MAVTFFPSWKRACSGGKAWHTISQIQTIWTVHCLDYFLTSVDRRSHGTHRKVELGGARGFAFVFEKLSELLVTLVTLWRKRGARCVWIASCASRALFRCLLRASWESNPVVQSWTRSTWKKRSVAVTIGRTAPRRGMKSWAEWFLKNFELCLLRLLPCDKRAGALLRTPSKTSSVVVLAFVPHWWGFFFASVLLIWYGIATSPFFASVLLICYMHVVFNSHYNTFSLISIIIFSFLLWCINLIRRNNWPNLSSGCKLFPRT